VLGVERAGGAEWSHRATKAGTVQWMDPRLEIGGPGGGRGEGGGGCGQASKHIDWGAGRIRGGRKNEQRKRRVARGREPSVATTRSRQEAGVILTDSPN
jgi:hypothetical protein